MQSHAARIQSATKCIANKIVNTWATAPNGFKIGLDTLLRLVRRSKEAFLALVEEKEMQAEFMSAPKMAKVQSNVLQFTARPGNGDKNDPRYSPRQLRTFNLGTKQWKP